MAPYDSSASMRLPLPLTDAVADAAHSHAREATLRDTAIALTRANRELEQFTYIAAHDLQEPLRLMTSFTELFARRYQHLVDDTGQQYLQYALNGARQMKALIADLLEYTQISSEILPFEAVPLDECAQQAARFLEALRANCGGALEWQTKLPTVRGHAPHLQLVFYHLLRNALLFRAAHAPQINVEAIRLTDAWRIGIHDNGLGITPEYHARVFMVFQRLTRDRAHPGTGIGLALCKKIVEMHGGRIWLESNTLGGTSVLFTLPDSSEDLPRSEGRLG
jgi:light-regulated signal transduction histidine kinase (bacteriophytochrome)